ncbi:MAG: UDP-2,3-diacylglucosamine diphosphatase [Alphaproteobacteria bacterium]|nr:UDP-2,3-diacylglucosamine diphosphatase [Alphaproteobacteria bacterium]
MAETAWSTNLYQRALPVAGAARRRPAVHRPVALPVGPRRHRTIFISDVHLGSRGCKAELLADFLEQNACDTLYLVGDIIDGWQLARRWYWTDDQTRVVGEILRKVDEGTRVVYVPGNHDEFLRNYCGRSVAGIEVVREAIHETAAGLRLLVLHGDQFDGVIGYAKWLAHLGDRAYALALALNDRLHALRHAVGLPYWSLSAYLKRTVKNAVEYVSRFEEVVARAAKPRGVDGVLCGHIHQAEIRQIGPILYLNDGDWVESCTAVVEDASGHLEILRWTTSSPAKDPAGAVAGAQGEAALIPA